MTRTRRSPIVALLLVLALILAACGGDDGGDEDAGGGGDTTTTAGEDGGDEGEDEGGEGGGFSVDTEDCPDDATEPIEGTIRIGTTMPLSGGVAAAAFAPVAAGFEAFVEYANENQLVEGYELELFIEDDQFDSTKTTPAVEKLIDEREVHLFAGMIGTANNQAVRDLLNEECYPQMLANTGAPIWGDVENYPWTTGGLVPYNTETAVYVRSIQEQFPDGATAAVFHVSSEFGEAYQAAFEELAGDANIEIVEEQTIENADSNPPTSQVSAIAAKQPDVILAVPLGAQCPTFMNEIANAKAATPGWDPQIYITATCASTLILQVAGQAADGIITIATLKDANDPANAEEPDVKAYLDEIKARGGSPGDDFATASVGWTNGEVVVQILNKALEDEGELTRASIINAARTLSYKPALMRDNVTMTMNGADDAYYLESMQVVQYDAETKTLTDVGELITDFEGQTQLPE
jgi:branched-chain amino acid transport system substrate-binding protein